MRHRDELGMFDLNEPEAWANAFGLADAPLFSDDLRPDTTHRVLLDGGYGTFALSVAPHADDVREARASWIWSSSRARHTGPHRGIAVG